MSDAPRPTTFRVPLGPGDVLRRYWLRLLVLLVAVVWGVQAFRTSFYDQGYAPEQPISFPHQRHAGIGIDCKYCHFNAARGKHAGVPPMSICLGCHGPQGGQVLANSPQIQKLNEIAEKGSYTDEAGVVHEGGVVHWNRVHKLPDFVYFPHKWHVAAGVACQTCHGPVETMPVVRQHATLTMGWCIECHRRGNYVGGRDYQPGHPETFSVGTANYDVQRARIAYDDVVEFERRRTKGAVDGHADHGHEGHDHAGHDHAGHDHAAHAHVEAAGAHADESTRGQSSQQYTAKLLPSSGGLPPEYQQAMQGMIADHPQLRDLPNWRLADLPETHQRIYQDLLGADVAEFERARGRAPTEDEERELFLRRCFMNSPTQCSTCHQ